MVNVVQTETTQQIRNEFETSCLELFRSLNCDVTRLEKGEALDEAPLSYIDAGSEEIEVVIVLRAPLPVLTITYPRFELDNILSVDDEKLEDWLSELANQLVGRFKNKMLNLGCTLSIGLPELVYDAHGVKLPIEKHQTYRYFFDIDKQCMECSLYLRLFNENMVLTPQQLDSGGAQEGELEMF